MIAGTHRNNTDIRELAQELKRLEEQAKQVLEAIQSMRLLMAELAVSDPRQVREL